MREGQRAQDLDPLSSNINLSVALAFVLAQQPDRAKAELEKVLEMDPAFAAAHSVLGLVHEWSGNYQDAIDEYEKARDSMGDNPVGLMNIEAFIVRVYASSGRYNEAKAVLAKVNGRAGVSQYTIAQIHAALGDRSQALEWLQQAYEAHDTSLLNVKVDAAFKVLHGDPKFDDLVRRVGLSP